VFTGHWPGFAAGLEGYFAVKVVGETKFIEMTHVSAGYSRALVSASPRIIGQLLSFNPDVIFTSAFSSWTLLALLLKPWSKSRVVIVYDGSSPNIDCQDSLSRLYCRRAMARFADAFITNTRAGMTYLTRTLRAKSGHVFGRPYEVPNISVLSTDIGTAERGQDELRRPVFLFVGEIVRRKGLHLLAEACSLLWQDGYAEWTLLIVGDGPERNELTDFVRKRGFERRVKWTGWVSYGNLGAHFQEADIFIFPTLEDIWGMAALEAMAFGKPVICSKWAGASEMIEDNKNGYVVDPYQPHEMASRMKEFVEKPHLIKQMGERSKQIMAYHTPAAVAKHLSSVVAAVSNPHDSRHSG
jgi:glycosyltransferase involved in cell wall biosynthesis